MAKTKTSKPARKPSPKGRNGKPLAHRNGKPLTHHAALAAALAADDPSASPVIVQPYAGAYAEPGFNLRIVVSTNRPDLRYIITVTDVTDPLNPGAPQALNIPAPIDHLSTQLFAADLPGAWFVADHRYQIRVSVDPNDGATPPHLGASFDVTSIRPSWWFVTTVNGTLPILIPLAAAAKV